MISELDDIPKLAGLPEPQRKTYFRLFDRVKNAHNWKLPINSTVDMTDEEAAVMSDAISTITGSRSIEVNVIDNKDRMVRTYRVTAEGYYNAMLGEIPPGLD